MMAQDRYCLHPQAIWNCVSGSARRWVFQTTGDRFSLASMELMVRRRAIRAPKAVIVEGIMLLRVLKAIGHTPVSMCLSTEKTTRRACEIVWNPYFRAYQPKERANFVLRWSSASHDARVLGAHHARHGR
jgi:hypothetical protein